MTNLRYEFKLDYNKLCSDVPTEVQALSSSVTSGWQVTTDNSIGTVCGWQSYMADSRFPTMDGSTSTTSIDYSSQGLTGTIPTEFGLATNMVGPVQLQSNSRDGAIPTGESIGAPRAARAQRRRPSLITKPVVAPTPHNRAGPDE